MKVPTYSAPTVKEAAAPVPMQNGAPAAAFGAPIAQGMEHAASIYQQVQDDADNLKSVDQDNKAAERFLDLTYGQQDGILNIKGRAVLAPTADGKALSETYIERAKKIGIELEADLTEAQRRKFRPRFEQRLLGFKEVVMRHENREITEYAKTVTNANVALESEAALKAWNNPIVINQAIANITDSLRAQAMREGLPADAQKVMIADKVSKVHAGVLAFALENKNLSYADDHLKQYGRDMEADDVLKYKGAIDKEQRADEAVAVAHEAWNAARPAVEPNNFDRLKTLVATHESGNRERDDKGNLITSSKGAQGKMQVMPATNKNPGYGVTPARDASDAERTRVGRDFLQAMLKEYGGDVRKALAAYNAGPGAVDKAVKDAKDGNYLALLPKETQHYVAAIGTKYASGVGSAPRITLEDLQNNVRQRMAGKPAAEVKLAVDQVTQLYDTNLKAKKQREEETVGEAYKQLDANGGNYAALPASIRTNLPGNQIDNLQTYATKRAKGIDAATDWNVYYELRKDESLLKATNLMAFKGKLADAEFKALVSEQDALRSGKHDSVTATRSATQILAAHLNEAGIDPTPKPDKGENSDAAKVGRAMREQQAAITAAETAKGKKLTPDEVERVTAQLFTNVTVKGRIFGTNSKPRFDLKPTDKIVVPESERPQIIAALQATKRPVNETMIRELYLRKNNLPGQ